MSEIRMFSSVSEAVRGIFGENRFVTKKTCAVGGDINEAWILTLDDGDSLFMKSNAPAALPNFLAEAAGLAAIRERYGHAVKTGGAILQRELDKVYQPVKK